MFVFYQFTIKYWFELSLYISYLKPFERVSKPYHAIQISFQNIVTVVTYHFFFTDLNSSLQSVCLIPFAIEKWTNWAILLFFQIFITVLHPAYYLFFVFAPRNKEWQVCWFRKVADWLWSLSDFKHCNSLFESYGMALCGAIHQAGSQTKSCRSKLLADKSKSNVSNKY